MRKIMFVLLVSVVLGLSACGKNANMHDDLQSKKWNVISAKGSAGSAEFGKEKATFNIGIMNVGFDYKIEGDKLTLENEKITNVFKLTKEGDEYKLSADDEETKEGIGDLTLSPVKK